MWGPGSQGLDESLASDLVFLRFPLKGCASNPEPSDGADFLMSVGFLNLLHLEVPGDPGGPQNVWKFSFPLTLKKAILL